MNRKSALSMAVAIASTLFFSACTKSETGNGSNDGLHHITLNAGSVSDKDESAESTASKCSNGKNEIATKSIFIDNSGTADFYWQKKDQIGVLASGSENLYPLTIESRSDDLKTATFGGDIKGTLGGYAVYPYNENHKISGNTLTYHLPSEYDFSISELDVDYLDSSDNVDSYITSANPALLAKITGEDESATTCDFKHLGGVLCIKIDKRDVSIFDINIIADRQISGDFSVDLTSSEPTIKTTSDATADADVMGTDNCVTIKGRQTDLKKSCVCYIPMPVGKYNIKVKLSYETANYGKWDIVSSVKTLEINRCNVKRASLNYSTLYKTGGYMLVNGIKYIDLGLPSGKLWATTNVGATLPADYGNYYALSEMTSALGSKKCHIPSDTEFQELIDNTDKEYTSGEKNSSGEWTAGVYLKKNTDNDCLIFFPFSGLYLNSSYTHKAVESCSWSSVNISSDYQKFLSISLNNGKVDAQVIQTFTTSKLTIRPVITP